jgi:hypothetical protein
MGAAVDACRSSEEEEEEDESGIVEAKEGD